jgi:hypothetical protein
MLIAAIFVGGLTAYYFGLRAGAVAAVAALAVLLVPLFFPRYAMYCWIGLAGVTVAIQQVGSRRKRPTDAVLAVAWLKGRAAKLWSRFGGGDRRD